MSSLLSGAWTSVKDPMKWFNYNYQEGAVREMFGGPNQEQADQLQQQEQEVANAIQATKQLQANKEQAAQAAADKIAADKAKADKEAKDAAAALAARRRGSSPIATSAQGLLGSAPVQYKMLLGQ
jgi:hypothetical protein